MTASFSKIAVSNKVELQHNIQPSRGLWQWLKFAFSLFLLWRLIGRARLQAVRVDLFQLGYGFENFGIELPLSGGNDEFYFFDVWWNFFKFGWWSVQRILHRYTFCKTFLKQSRFCLFPFDCLGWKLPVFFLFKIFIHFIVFLSIRFWPPNIFDLQRFRSPFSRQNFFQRPKFFIILILYYGLVSSLAGEFIGKVAIDLTFKIWNAKNLIWN